MHRHTGAAGGQKRGGAVMSIVHITTLFALKYVMHVTQFADMKRGY
jgi:hypothetical protein